MKHIYLLTLLAFFACQSASEKTENAPMNASKTTPGTDTNAILANIRTHYQLIKADSTKDKHSVVEAECDGLFGTISVQTQNDKIQAISYSYGSDHGGITEEYYMRGDSLLFVFVEEGSWMFDVNNKDEQNPKTIDEVTESRYYFHQHEVMKALRKHVKASTPQVEKLLSTAKNEPIAGAKASEWLKKVADLREVAKSKKLEGYLCK